MKKNLFFGFIVALLMFVGVSGVKAQQVQANFQVPDMSPEAKEMAEQVISQQLTDPDAANKTFGKLIKKIKNNKEDLVAVGKFFLDKNIYPCAKQCANQAYTVDPQYVPGLMLSGYVCMLRKDWGGAGQKFDEILNVDPSNVEAMRLSARMYKYVNPYAAKDLLNKIIEVEPNNLAAYKELGDIAYSQDEYKDAVAAYEKYYNKTDVKDLDLRACENYLLSLFSTQDFSTCQDVAEAVLPIDPKDLVVRRMLFFSQVENMDFQKATESMKYFTNKEYDDSLYLYLDYVYAASYAKEIEDFPAAIQYYREGLQKDSTKAAGFKELASLLRRNKQAIEAIPVYEKYLALVGDKADLTDQFGLGQIFIAAKAAEGNTEEQKMKFIEEGDKIFAKIMEEKPDSYLGSFYRAQLWITNPQAAEEKPKEYYTIALDVIGDDADLKAQKKTALTYLMVYYLKTDNNDQCKVYCDKVLELDPEDKLANQVKGLLD